MADNILTIEEYLGKGKFLVPNYQRGFKWGVPDSDGKCAVRILIDDLIHSFTINIEEYFIQGVTVFEDINGQVVIIDGQQRTTTFFLLLKFLGYEGLPEIDYAIREESKKWLKSLISPVISIEEENFDEEYQDIFYFKKALRTFKEQINGNVDKDNFRSFILKKVKLFYITISPEQATKVFSMMNGQKAIMKSDELVKAAILSKTSRSHTKDDNEIKHLADLNGILQLLKSKVGEEWEINTLRSKYAREWDKWLYWWNRKDVKDFFRSANNPLGLLLVYYYEQNKGDIFKNRPYTFSSFNECFFCDIRDSKNHFKGIRDLQKTFEDWFNNYEIYNYLGMILECNIEEKKETFLHFINLQKRVTDSECFKEYAKWALVGCTHKQITKSEELPEGEDAKEAKAEIAIDLLSQKEVYGSCNDFALRQLLRRNVEIDCKLERKFDFSLYGEKSLEHIYPKSWEQESVRKLNFSEENKDKLSVHSIGNLVLIKKNENSQFGYKSFEEKKSLYFEVKNTKWSLKLLHSVSVFSKKEWNAQSIEENQKEFICELKEYYKLKL
jgi:hypothetical protein